MYAVQDRSGGSPQDPVRFRSSLSVLGAAQTLLGLFSLAFDITGFFIGSHSEEVYGSGIYTGILFALAGLLSLIGSCGNDLHCLNAALVVNTIGICACIPGLNFASIETSYFTERWRQKPTQDAYFHKVKNFFIITVMVCQLAMAVVRTALTCSSQWLCCRSHQVVSVQEAQANTDHLRQYSAPPPPPPPPTYIVHYIAGPSRGGQGADFPSPYSPHYLHPHMSYHEPPVVDLPPSYEDAVAGTY